MSDFLLVLRTKRTKVDKALEGYIFLLLMMTGDLRDELEGRGGIQHFIPFLASLDPALHALEIIFSGFNLFRPISSYFIVKKAVLEKLGKNFLLKHRRKIILTFVVDSPFSIF